MNANQKMLAGNADADASYYTPANEVQGGI